MDNTIYIIDDDASIRESLTFLFSTLSWPVENFASIDAFATAAVVCPWDHRVVGKREARNQRSGEYCGSQKCFHDAPH